MVNSEKDNSIERPPIVAVMGHIDHGKSKLLDYIRKTNIVDKEAGGITQHLSAYEVVHSGKKITFLDTPGHEAFELMRQRGALICDIAILIVSAEEAVKTQTIEALNSIKSHNRPFIVAINKIDKPAADIERTKQTLAENGVFVEGYGGNVPCALISAKEGTGVTELLDLLILVAEMEELRGNPEENAEGFLLESHQNPQVGITATLVIKNGTLRTGDFILIHNNLTKIKRIENFLGQTVKELTFSAPAKIFGFSEVPKIGCPFYSFSEKAEAEKWLAENKQVEEKLCPMISQFEADAENSLVIPVIIKSDVTGTAEAVEKELSKIKVERVAIRIVDKGIGAINESDLKLISAFPGAIIIGFKVKVEGSASSLAEKSNVKIKTSDIIYKLSEWLEEIMKERAPKITSEETIGKAKILKTFGRTKDKQVVGGQASEGQLIKGKKVKIMRREVEIGRGEIIELQMQKIKTHEVNAGNQFGAEISCKIEIAPGDVVEVFDLVTK